MRSQSMTPYGISGKCLKAMTSHGYLVIQCRSSLDKLFALLALDSFFLGGRRRLHESVRVFGRGCFQNSPSLCKSRDVPLRLPKVVGQSVLRLVRILLKILLLVGMLDLKNRTNT